MLRYAIGSRRLELATVAERRVRMVDVVSSLIHLLNISTFTFRKIAYIKLFSNTCTSDGLKSCLH